MHQIDTLIYSEKLGMLEIQVSTWIWTGLWHRREAAEFLRLDEALLVLRQCLQLLC